MRKEFSLCDRPGDCCPKLAVNRSGKSLSFQLVGDDGAEIRLTKGQARSLAMQIFKEL